MLLVDAVSKHYDSARGPVVVLERVSMTMNRGDAMAIMGPSGCGKSTLLYILGALEPPSSGTVHLDNHDPHGLNESAQASFRATHIGFVFQDHLLLPQLSALDNVLVPTLTMGAAEAAPMPARARDLLQRVGLADRAHHRPAELSGGERQRVAIARALIRQPSLLLCDEPTGNLDRTSADTVGDLLVALNKDANTMLIVVTHSPGLASRFSRRVELHEGRLQAAP